MRPSSLFPLLLAASTLLACGANEAQIRAEIEAANHCEADDDCVSAGSVCPFGCYILVNKSEVGHIQELLEGYESNCVYDCVAATGFVCGASGTCGIVTEMP